MLNKIEVENLIDNRLNKYFSQLEALNEIKRIFPNLSYFPPTRGWAGSPDFLLNLIELIVCESPKYVIEFGSGVSSLVLGAAMKKFSQGKVFSFDHEESFTVKSNKILKVNNLSDIVKVKFSPLMTHIWEGNEWQWYDESEIKKIENGIDLVVVDGPPKFLQKKSRFLALPMVFEKLSEKSTIVLDDSNRPNEKFVIEDWIIFLELKKVKYLISNFEYFDKGLTIIKIEK